MSQRTSLEPDNTVECSGQMTLRCGCGERLTLLGLKEDWLAEQRTNFGCRCGQTLTLADRLDEEVVQEFKQIMQGAFNSHKVDAGLIPLQRVTTPVLGRTRGFRRQI